MYDFRKTAKQEGSALNVLVTGGGTTAPIDDVRTITNISTGRFAASISECWLECGANVWHIHTPTALLPVQRHARLDLEAEDPSDEYRRLGKLHQYWRKIHERLHLVSLKEGTVSEYAETMRQVLTSNPIDVAFLAMAVSDYEPVLHEGKLRSDRSEMTIHCRRTLKVIRSVRDWAPSVYLVGFKLLSRSTPDELIREAEASGTRNRADLTIANDIQTLAAGRHTVHLVRTGFAPETLDAGPDLAERLVDRVMLWARDRCR